MSEIENHNSLEDGLKARTAKNISFNLIAKVAVMFLQAVANIVLTRQLLPGDYGLVGMAIIFVNFFTQFGDFGISNAVMRKQNLSERDMYTGFTVRVGQGVLVALMCLAVAPLAPLVFDNKDVPRVIAAFSVLFAINSLGFVPYAYLNRELRHDKLFVPQVGSTLIGSIVAILLALYGFRHWSLVFSTLSTAVSFVLLLNLVRPVRLKFCFDRQVAREFITYGSGIFMIGMVSYAVLNVDNFIVGAVSGQTSLGYYMIAFNWGSLICTILTGTVASVLFPTFSRLQGDKNRLRSAYLKTLEFIAVAAILVNISLLFSGREFLYYVLGHSSDKWLPSLLALQILCVYGVLRSIIEPGANLMMVIGETKVPFRANLLAAAVELSLLYPALKLGGIAGVAVVVAVAVTFQYAVYFIYLKKVLDLRPCQLITQLRPAALSILVTVGGMSLYQAYVEGMSIVLFGAKLFVTATLFLVTYSLLTRGELLREVKNMLSSRHS